MFMSLEALGRIWFRSKWHQPYMGKNTARIRWDGQNMCNGLPSSGENRFSRPLPTIFALNALMKRAGIFRRQNLGNLFAQPLNSRLSNRHYSQQTKRQFSGENSPFPFSRFHELKNCNLNASCFCRVTPPFLTILVYLYLSFCKICSATTRGWKGALFTSDEATFESDK